MVNKNDNAIIAIDKVPLMKKEKLIRQNICFAIRLLRIVQLQAPINVLRPSKFIFHVRKQTQKSLPFRRA